MPVVRARQQIDTAPIPGVRKTSAQTNLSTGVGVAAAEGQKGEAEAIASAQKWGAVAQFGQTGARIAGSVYGQMVEQEKQAADQVAVWDASNKISDFKRRELLDPDNGAFTKMGKDALTLPEDIREKYTKLTGEIETGLKTDRQRRAFLDMKNREGQQIDMEVARHTYGEQRKYEAKTLTALVENKKNDAITAALDPRTVGLRLNEALDAIVQAAPRQGMDAEQLQATLEQVQTETHVGVIKQLVATDHASQADDYYKETKSLIKGEARAELDHLLDTATTAQTGLKTSEAIWQQFGPKGDADPINIDTMETAAREKFADDPKALTATLHFLHERKAGVDAGRKDREELRTGGLWTAVSQGASLADLSKMPEFLTAPGKLQAQLSDYVVGHAEREASRGAAAESRAYTREQRGRAALEQKGWSKYWDLSSPAVLQKTSENALQAMRGELGDEHVNRLLTQKRTIAKSDDTVRAATIDEDLFKTIASSAGIAAYGKDADKAELGFLKNAVETAIDVEQQKIGKALGREQKETIMRSLMDQRVMLNQWGRDPEKLAVLVKNPEDRATAYVPIAKVPPTTLTQYLNYARSLSPELQRMSDTDLQTRFSDRIQRAYGLRVLGGTRAEIEAALKGQE